MSREIKFRAWTGKDMRFPPPLGEWDFEDCEFFSGYNKRPTILMQFTGLRDKNGKEICEGDIVESAEYPFTADGLLNYRGEIFWFEEDAAWAVEVHRISDRVVGRAVGGMLSDYEDSGQDSVLVIVGNIHESPELLK